MGHLGNRESYEARFSRPDILFLTIRLTGAGAAALVDKGAGKFGSVVKSISRSSAGIYVVTLREKYNGTIEYMSPIGVVAGTAGHITDFSTEDLDGTGLTIDATFTIRNVDAAAAAADIANNADVYVMIGVRTHKRN